MPRARFSCRQTPTRRVDLLMNGKDLKRAYMAHWVLEHGFVPTPTAKRLAEASWQTLWPWIKEAPSYSLLVNGRVEIHCGRLVDKRAGLTKAS